MLEACLVSFQRSVSLPFILYSSLLQVSHRSDSCYCNKDLPLWYKHLNRIALLDQTNHPPLLDRNSNNSSPHRLHLHLPHLPLLPPLPLPHLHLHLQSHSLSQGHADLLRWQKNLLINLLVHFIRLSCWYQTRQIKITMTFLMLSHTYLCLHKPDPLQRFLCL